MRKALICTLTVISLLVIRGNEHHASPRPNLTVTSDQHAIILVRFERNRLNLVLPLDNLRELKPKIIPVVIFSQSKPYSAPKPVIHYYSPPVVVTSATWCKGSASMTARVESWAPQIALYGPGGVLVKNSNPWPVQTMLSHICYESGGIPTEVHGNGPAYSGGPACGLLQLYYCPGPGFLDGNANIDYAYNQKYLKSGLGNW